MENANKQDKTKKCEITDQTDHFTPKIWEEQITQIQFGKSYTFLNHTTWEYQTETILTLTTQSTIENVVNVANTPRQQNVTMERKITAIEQYYCPKCRKPQLNLEPKNNKRVHQFLTLNVVKLIHTEMQWHNDNSM